MFYHYYEPGQKTFDVSTPSVAGSDLLMLNIEAGKTYFVRGEILMGWPAGRPRMFRTSANSDCRISTELVSADYRILSFDHLIE